MVVMAKIGQDNHHHRHHRVCFFPIVKLHYVSPMPRLKTILFSINYLSKMPILSNYFAVYHKTFWYGIRERNPERRPRGVF